MPDKTLTKVFTDIADAIREKAGSESKISPLKMAEQIINLPSDGGEDIPLPSYVSPLLAEAMKSAIAATDSIDNWEYTLSDDKVIISQYKEINVLETSNYLASYRFVIVRDSYVIDGQTYHTYFRNSNDRIACPDHLVIENLRLDGTGTSTFEPGSVLIIQDAAVTNKLLIDVQRPVHFIALPSTVTWRPINISYINVETPIETLYYSYKNRTAQPHSADDFKCIQHLFIEPNALAGGVNFHPHASWDVSIYTDSSISSLTHNVPGSVEQPMNNRFYFSIYTNAYDESAYGVQDDLDSYGQDIANELYDEKDIVCWFKVLNYAGQVLASGEYVPEGGEQPGT